MELHLISHFHILILIYQWAPSYIYNFQSKYSLTLHDLSHSDSHILGFQTNPSSYLPLSINSLNLHLHLSLFNVAYYYKHLHLIYIYMNKSYAIIYDVSIILDIRLSNLIFMSLITSGTHNLADGLLKPLLLPLHLLLKII